MTQTAECPVCGLQAVPLLATFDGSHLKCEACGEFKIAGTAVASTAKLQQLRPKLRGWICDQHQLGEVPLVTTYTLDAVEALSMPTVVDRAYRLLAFVVKVNSRIDAEVDRRPPPLLGVSYSLDQSEVNYLFEFLRSEGFLAPRNGTKHLFTVTPKGYARADELTAKGASTSQGFVAMWFDPTLDPIWRDGFAVGIRKARYNPLRVDGVEHVGKIDDEIISQIRRSRFVVADFTGQRGGVYFEAGYALGQGTPVIWTCRKDEISKLHFDTRQFNTIDWTAADDLAARLQRRIEAVIGLGPVLP